MLSRPDYLTGSSGSPAPVFCRFHILPRELRSDLPKDAQLISSIHILHYKYAYSLKYLGNLMINTLFAIWLFMNPLTAAKSSPLRCRFPAMVEQVIVHLLPSSQHFTGSLCGVHFPIFPCLESSLSTVLKYCLCPCMQEGCGRP